MSTPKLVFAALFIAAVLAASRDAAAFLVCGSAPPDVTAERVLIVHDAPQGFEHLVFEVTFSPTTDSFTFIVPTPSRPEVSWVEEPLFDDLTRSFPVEAGDGGTVSAQRRVGSFETSVFSPGERTAFEGSPCGTGPHLPLHERSWIDHYYPLTFHFTVFRYRPLDVAATAEITTTVRLSFPTPEAFFPYLDPEPYASFFHGMVLPPPHRTRTLSVWVVSDRLRQPRARYAEKGQEVRWSSSWTVGKDYDATRAHIAQPLGELAGLLPLPSTLVVQTFLDREPYRQGWSDVLLPGVQSDVAGAAGDALLGARPLHWAPAAPPPYTPAPSPTRTRATCACTLGASTPGGGAAALWLALALLIVSRMATSSRG